MQEIDQFFVAHFNIIAGIVLLIGGYIKLVLSSKSNGLKLDTVITETKNMTVAQQNIQLEVNRQGIQMSNVEKEVLEIKNDMRSRDKEWNQLNARLAAVESQLRAS